MTFCRRFYKSHKVEFWAQFCIKEFITVKLQALYWYWIHVVHFSISFFFFRLATTTTTTTTATANKRIWLFGKLNTLKSKLFILKKYKKKGLNFKKDSDFFNPNEKIENLLWLKSDATLRSNQYLELFLIDNNWIYILVNFSFRL